MVFTNNMKLTFITGNKDKFNEASQIIPELLQKDIDLIEIQSLDSQEIINHKLNEARRLVSGDIVVEDNSLSLDCLNGLPGSLIKWFLKTIGNDGLVKITQDFDNSNATAKVIVGLLNEDGTTEFFTGEVKGKIVTPRGNQGFGWDPIFEPTGFTKTYGEMTMEEKNQINARIIAIDKLKEFLIV